VASLKIKGYSAESLERSIPRRRQIEDHLAKDNQYSPESAPQIAVTPDSGKKLETLSHEEMQERHES